MQIEEAWWTLLFSGVCSVSSFVNTIWCYLATTTPAEWALCFSHFFVGSCNDAAMVWKLLWIGSPILFNQNPHSSSEVLWVLWLIPIVWNCHITVKLTQTWAAHDERFPLALESKNLHSGTSCSGFILWPVQNFTLQVILPPLKLPPQKPLSSSLTIPLFHANICNTSLVYAWPPLTDWHPNNKHSWNVPSISLCQMVLYLLILPNHLAGLVLKISQFPIQSHVKLFSFKFLIV